MNYIFAGLIIAAWIYLTMSLSWDPHASKAANLIIGLGCAPVYPSIIHSTPAHFGADKSQAIIGVQMASAYIGTCTMPPLFGFLAGLTGIGLLPVYLLILLVLMSVMHELLNRKTS